MRRRTIRPAPPRLVALVASVALASSVVAPARGAENVLPSECDLALCLDAAAVRRQAPSLAVSAMARDPELRRFLEPLARRGLREAGLDEGILRGIGAVARMVGLPALLRGRLWLAVDFPSGPGEVADALLVAETAGREAALEALERALEEVAVDWTDRDVPTGDDRSPHRLRRLLLPDGRSVEVHIGATGDAIVAATRPDWFERATQALAGDRRRGDRAPDPWIRLEVGPRPLTGRRVRALAYELAASDGDLVERLVVEPAGSLPPLGGVARNAAAAVRGRGDLVRVRFAFEPRLLEPLLGDAWDAVAGRAAVALRRAPSPAALPELEAAAALRDAPRLAVLLPRLLEGWARRLGAPPPEESPAEGARAAGAFVPPGRAAVLGPVRYAVSDDALWVSSSPSFPPPSARLRPPPDGEAWLVAEADLRACVVDLWGWLETAARAPDSPLRRYLDPRSLPIAEDVADHLGRYRLVVARDGGRIRVEARSAIGGPLLLIAAAIGRDSAAGGGR